MIQSLKQIVQKFFSHRIVRFALVGGLSSLVYALVVAVLLYFKTTTPAFASIVGYLAALLPNFVAQKKFTFRSQGNSSRELRRFIVVQSVNIFVSTMVMHIGVSKLGWPYPLGIFIVIIVIPISSYIAFSLYVFATGEANTKNKTTK